MGLTRKVHGFRKPNVATTGGRFECFHFINDLESGLVKHSLAAQTVSILPAQAVHRRQGQAKESLWIPLLREP